MKHALMEYVNHRGEKRPRKILPITIWFGKTDWHQEPQWFLRAYDLEKPATDKDSTIRDFAMSGITAWSAP